MEEERLEAAGGCRRCTVVVFLPLKVPALPLLMSQTPLVAATGGEGEQTLGRDAVSCLERRKAVQALSFLCIFASMNLQTAEHNLFTRRAPASAAGSWVAYLNHSDCSFSSEGAAQK